MMQEATILNLWHREAELAWHIANAEKSISEAMGMKVQLKPIAYEHHAAIAAMCRLVADTLGITYKELMSDSRPTKIVNARQIAVYMVRKHLAHIGPETIASSFGKTNGMVYGADKVIKRFIDINDPIIVKKVALCEKAFFNVIKDSL